MSLVRLKSWLAVLGSASAVAVAAAVFDWRTLLSFAGRMPFTAIAGSALLCGLTSLLLALRWAMIATPSGAPLRGAEILVALQAALFNLITPAALGADVFRIARGAGQRLRRVGLVLVERLFGVWAQAFVYGAAILLTPWPIPAVLVQAAWVFAAVAIGGSLAIAATPSLGLADPGGRIRRILAHLVAGLTGHPLRKRLALAVLSLAAVLSWVAACHVMARGGAMPFTLTEVAMITIVTEFARLLPFAVQGIGVREAVFAWLSHRLGGSAEEGFVVCALVYAINALVICAVGCVAAVALPRLRHRPEALRAMEV